MRLVLPACIIGFLLAGPVAAGGDSLNGYWKFSILEGGQQISFWLLHLETKDGKLTASADSLKGAPRIKVDEIKQAGDVFTMKLRATVVMQGRPQEITFDYEGKIPKAGAKKIFGSLNQADLLMPAVLEATTAKNIFELDREVLKLTPGDPKSLPVVVDIIERAAENKVAAKELQEWIDSSLKTAEQCGPRLLMSHQLKLMGKLESSKGYASVAADTARRIGKQIDAKSPLDAQLQLLSRVASVLRNAEAKEEAKTLETRIETLEGQAYTTYAKDALNYKIEKVLPRKKKSNRAVLVELFTGAQCPPCVAADMAFDGLEKTYGPGDVVLLQYHMHIPRPEPMSNPDSDARFEFYADLYEKKIRGTPASLFNGKPEVAGGGGRDDAAEKYKEFCGVINKLLEAPATVKLSATAARKGEKIAITAKVQGLEKPGEKVRLRFALVEDWVRYKGSNGLQYHHRVVRALPGGAKGVALKEKDSDHTASVDLEALRKTINKYLDEDYPEGQRPLRLRNLSVVAFVQSDESTEVLQAVNVHVKDEK